MYHCHLINIEKVSALTFSSVFCNVNECRLDVLWLLVLMNLKFAFTTNITPDCNQTILPWRMLEVIKIGP